MKAVDKKIHIIPNELDSQKVKYTLYLAREYMNMKKTNVMNCIL